MDYVENFKNKARERRFIIRNFSFDPNAAQARVLLFFNRSLHMGANWQLYRNSDLVGISHLLSPSTPPLTPSLFSHFHTEQNAKKALETSTLELQAMHAQLIQWCKVRNPWIVSPKFSVSMDLVLFSMCLYYLKRVPSSHLFTQPLHPAAPKSYKSRPMNYLTCQPAPCISD